MQNKVLAYCREAQLLSPGETVTCGVSGGIDSVVLLDILCTLRAQLNLTVRAAHFNHQLRGQESDRDESFVRALCQSRAIPLTVGRGDVRARADATGESIEEAARAMRYAFFETLPGTLATAHNADDNLETVLLNLVRGTSLAGLCGIAPRRGRYVRPLLCLTREQITAWAAQRDLSYVDDSTNALDGCVRNRLRHHVVPLLKAENPSVCQAAQRACALLREDDACLQASAHALLERARLPHGYSCQTLSHAPQAIFTRALRLALQQLQIPKLTSSHILSVAHLVRAGGPSDVCALPGGYRAQRAYDVLTFSRESERACFQPVPLNIGGVTHVPELGLVVCCRLGKNFEEIPKNGSTFVLKYDTIGAEAALTLRPRAPGDSMRLPGGRRTLKRLMIDRKIPAAQRGLVPVIACDTGVLAVYPIGINLDCAATAGEDAVIITIEKEEMRRYD